MGRVLAPDTASPDQHRIVLLVAPRHDFSLTARWIVRGSRASAPITPDYSKDAAP